MKTQNFRSFFAAFFLAVMFLGLNLNLSAQPDKKCEGGKGQCCAVGPCFCDIPKLTDDQKGKIEKLKLPHHKEMMTLKNQLGEKKAQLRSLSTADKPDMAAINRLIDEMGAIKTTMMKKKSAFHQDVRALLTDEQRIQFDMHHPKDDDRGQGMGKRHGKGKGCGQGHGKGCGDNENHPPKK